MAGLGLILSWGGYLLFVWGYSKVKTAYTGNSLSISDLALPSHRTNYLNAMRTLPPDPYANKPGISATAPGATGVVGGLNPGQVYPGSPGGGGGGFPGEGIVGGMQ